MESHHVVTGPALDLIVGRERQAQACAATPQTVRDMTLRQLPAAAQPGHRRA
jgi:hypothetical protein